MGEKKCEVCVVCGSYLRNDHVDPPLRSGALHFHATDFMPDFTLRGVETDFGVTDVTIHPAVCLVCVSVVVASLRDESDNVPEPGISTWRLAELQRVWDRSRATLVSEMVNGKRPTDHGARKLTTNAWLNQRFFIGNTISGVPVEDVLAEIEHRYESYVRRATLFQNYVLRVTR